MNSRPLQDPQRQPVRPLVFSRRLIWAWLVRLTSRGLSTAHSLALNQQILLMNWTILSMIVLCLSWVVIWGLLELWILAVLTSAFCVDLALIYWMMGRDESRYERLQWRVYGTLLVGGWLTADYLGPETGAYVLPALTALLALLLVPLSRCRTLLLQVMLAGAVTAFVYLHPHIMRPPVMLPADLVGALRAAYYSLVILVPVLALLYERLAHNRTLSCLLEVMEKQTVDARELAAAQTQSQETAAQLQALMDGSSALLVLIDRQGRIVRFNDVFASYCRRIEGIDPAVGNCIYDQPMTYGGWFLLHFEEALQGRTVRMVENFTDPQGETVVLDVSLQPSFDAQGEVQYVAVTTLDITENRLIKLQQQETLLNLQALIDNNDFAIWSVDTDHRLLSINRRYRQLIESLSGRPVQLGDDVTEAFDPAIRNYWKMIYRRALAGEQFVTEWHDSRFNVLNEIHASPIPSPEGSIQGAALLMIDITARKAAERQLIEAKEQAEHASQVKSRFLAHISHDLRNPVHAILGCVEVLNQTELNPEQKPVAAMLERAGRRLRDNLDNLLDYSSLEAGRFLLVSAPFDLQQALADCTALYEFLARQQGIGFQAILPPGRSLPWVLGDKTRLLRVLDNLVGNAIKFTDEGTVSLEVEARQPDRQNELALTFTITDTGSGIPRDQLDAIFKPFVQVDSSSKKSVQGIGLGLSIVQQLVELMQGQLEIESDLGQGTTVRLHLRLPLAPRDIEDSLDELREQARKLEHVRVLVAEDDEANALYLQHFLTGLGWKVRIAPNGRYVLRLLEREPFDVVIMDGAMPVMDGMEATERIRQLERERPDRPRMPIVVLTGYARGSERDRFLSLGVQGFLTKPVEEIDLLRALLEVVLAPQAENIA